MTDDDWECHELAGKFSMMNQTKFRCVLCGLPVMKDDGKAYIRFATFDDDREYVESVCGRCSEAE